MEQDVVEYSEEYIREWIDKEEYYRSYCNRNGSENDEPFVFN